MIRIYLCATNTDIGKTYTSLKLIEAFSSLGYRVGVMKPIETGVVKNPQDATLLLNEAKKYNPDFASIMIEEICPIQFTLPSAPFVAKKKEKINFEKLSQASQKLSRHCDILLIESAGGLMTPVEDDFLMRDFATFFDAKILLITDDQLGCINNILLNIHLLNFHHDSFVWCVNQKSTDGSFETVSLPYFQAKFGQVLTVQKDIKQIANSLLSLSRE